MLIFKSVNVRKKNEPYLMYLEFDTTWFSKIADNKWIENNVYAFEEMKCDSTYFTIYDKSRELTLQLAIDGSKVLYNDKVLYSNNSKNKRTRIIKPIVHDPGNKYAIVMLYTKNFSHVCCHSEANIVAYCKRHKHTCYIYRDTMTDDHPTWNKPLVLADNLHNHEYIMWIDSDAIFTNFSTKLEEVIAKQPNKDLLLCDDIGGWKFNAGVQIWKNSEWSREMLKKWWNMEHVGHLQGGDQVQLIDLTSKQDPKYEKHHIFKQTEFNCHPQVHKEGMYIIHMMGMSGEERIKTFKYWNSKNNINI